jgi:hypothetical protein
MKAMEVLEIDMEATTSIHMEGMDISTTQEMSTTIMATKGHKNHSNGGNNGYDRKKDNNFMKKDISQVVCYKCNNKGHYANDCRGKKDDSNKPNTFQKGHVNHVSMEEVYEEPDAVHQRASRRKKEYYN